MQVVELPACVCPAGCQHDVAARGQPFESGVTVNLQNAAECFEVKGRSLRLAVGAVVVDRGRRIGSTPRPIVTRVEEWCVEASSAEEARELLDSGAGHRCHLGECVHIDVESVEAE